MIVKLRNMEARFATHTDAKSSSVYIHRERAVTAKFGSLLKEIMWLLKGIYGKSDQK